MMMKQCWNFGFRYKIYTVLLAGILSQVVHPAYGQITMHGSIVDYQSGTTLPGAHILLQPGNIRTVSDHDGNFIFRDVKTGEITIQTSFMGYARATTILNLIRDTSIRIRLKAAALLGEEVNIVATRAQERYPTPFTSISANTIKSVNLGKDIPFLIQQTPSVVVTSDAGNGIGYSSISIRGTDLTRINVTVNGIPLNDAESQGVWFVDLPDMASSTEDIQIQRGVGTSTNGAGAFGATISMKTSDLRQDPYGEVNLSGGSYNTFKSTLRFGTGLLNNGLSVDGRLSMIRTDGYIDRAASSLKSYYFSAGYFGSTTTLKLITFSGLEDTYQAWNGVPKDSLETNRTYNPCGEYYDSDGNRLYYKNQVDHYQQDHYQLILSQKISGKWTLNSALHYTRGSGYYENYRMDDALAGYGLDPVILGTDTVSHTDLVNRKMMDNDFYGLTFSLVGSIGKKWQTIFGGAMNRYIGNHFGKVIWAKYASNGTNDRNWYENKGDKTDLNIFWKGSYSVAKKVVIFGDLQYRHVGYRMSGVLDDQRSLYQLHNFNFFNPKAGIYITLNKHHEMFASFGIANREPSRNNYKDADPDRTPSHETLFDVELGYSYRNSLMTINANAYFMKYRNQLVLTGEINNVGEAVMVNVPHSYRLGAEIAATVNLIPDHLLFSFTTTLSRNKISNFVHYIDLYDVEWNFLGQQRNNLGETDLSFSPWLSGSGTLTYKPIAGLTFSWSSKYVGRQFLDNTSNHSRMLHDYFVNGIQGSWSIKGKFFREIAFNILINNIFSYQYESNGWVYPYILDTKYNEYNGYFTQAPIHVLGGITINL
jgi:iron complex outermembrane receptor protein